jgi:hypothetical protein
MWGWTLLYALIHRSAWKVNTAKSMFDTPHNGVRNSQKGYSTPP